MYDRKFYKGIHASARASAIAIVPLLIQAVQPRSIVDVGCGDGTWLKVFAENGVADYLGLDGAYVGTDALCIPPECFLARDLAQPLNVGRTFDLATSLEVAEHLQKCAGEKLVDELASLAPVVAFSAAIPRQGGAGHVNERWQDYWAALFRARGYVAVDYIRPKIWSKEHVAAWYIQNLLIYVDVKALDRYRILARTRAATKDNPISIVHPRLYESALSLENWTVRGILGAAVKVMINAARWRIRKLRRE